VPPKDYTDKIKKNTAASQFLQPFAGGDDESEDESKENAHNADPETSHENEDGDFLDKMLNNGLPKKTDLQLHGIYLEPDLSKLLNKLSKQGGRGAKTRIVNDAMRKYFKEKGLL
jgi:hypothetical protein